MRNVQSTRTFAPVVLTSAPLLALMLISVTPLDAQAPAGPATTARLLLAAQQELAVTGDRVIEADESVDDVVVASGDLTVRGKVGGDALVLNGDLILEEGGLIEGDALVVRGEIRLNGGRVRGRCARWTISAGWVEWPRWPNGMPPRRLPHPMSRCGPVAMAAVAVAVRGSIPSGAALRACSRRPPSGWCSPGSVPRSFSMDAATWKRSATPCAAPCFVPAASAWRPAF